MCTLSWLSAQDGYEVFFNRDEARVRGPEAPVSELELKGVRCLLPRDTDFQGTWIATNEHGTTTCLLNGYHATHGAPRDEYVSRGRLVFELADATGVTEVRDRLAAWALEVYRPFVLASFAAGCDAPLVHVWDGAALRVESDATCPIVSSSRDRDRATATRQAELARLSAGHIDSDVLGAFHRSHADGPSSNSTCMHRDDAETRSLSHIRVEATSVQFVHHHGAPCSTPEFTDRRVPRRLSSRSVGTQPTP